MTDVSMSNETANVRELSANELDQAAGGHRGSDVIPALIIGATAVTVVVGMVAGLIRNIFGGVE